MPDTGRVRHSKSSAEPKWWDFIAYRRQFVSDRTWFGAGFVAVGLGSLAEFSGWWEVLALASVVFGAVLIGSGVRRALDRQDSGPRG
jgi:hypothetical protein